MTSMEEDQGDQAMKNSLGQFHLDDILTHPQQKIAKDCSHGYEIYAPDGEGPTLGKMDLSEDLLKIV